MSKVFGFSAIAVTVILLYILTWIGVAPMYKLMEIESVIQADSLSASKVPQHLNVAPIALGKEWALKNAQASLLGNDSIQLIIDLQDSAVALFINGITVHKVKATVIKVDQVLTKLSNSAYLKTFFTPLTINFDTASFVKEPIVVREAPKDTLEASLNAYKPDTVVQTPAFWQIPLPFESSLLIAQSEMNGQKEKEMYREFTSLIKQKSRNENLRRFFTLQRPTYIPTIEIQIPADDLRAIYRAVPKGGKMVIRL